MTVTENRPTQARSNGLSYQQLLDTDSREVPDVLRWESPAYLGDQDVKTAILDQVAAALPQSGQAVIVSHSLGTIWALATVPSAPTNLRIVR